MSLREFDNYPNLPGMMTDFKDGGLKVRSEFPIPDTDSVLLLGTAVDGPVMEPVAVDANSVEIVFGKSIGDNRLDNGSTLVKAFEEAYAAGCRDIRLMRISGSQASVKVSTTQENKVEIGRTNGEQVLAPGLNVETDFVLSAAVEEGVTVTIDEVTVEGVVVAVADVYTFDGLTNTVTILADTVNQGVPVRISYTVDNAGITESFSESGENQDVNWTTKGEDKIFTLDQVPTQDVVKVYVGAVELAPEAYTVDGATLTILSGYMKKDKELLATFTYHDATKEDTFFTLESVFGGEVYNQLQVDVIAASNDPSEVEKVIKISKPQSKKLQTNEPALEYRSEDFKDLEDLARAINNDPRNNVVRAIVPNRFKKVQTTHLRNTNGERFHGGDDGLDLSPDKMFNILGGARDSSGFLVTEGAYHLLENYTVDTIVPLGVYADTKLPGLYDNFAEQLAMACAVISHRNTAVQGVIGASSPDDPGLSSIKAHYDYLLNNPNDFYMRDRAGNILQDSDGLNIDLGRFINVVAGPDILVNTARHGTYATNSPAAFAGYVSGLNAASSPTNKVLPFARGLRYRFSAAQLDKLTEARYVTYRTKNNGQTVAVTDAPTAAQPTSDYRRTTTVRSVKETINNIREVCDPYIGEPNEVAQRNAMSAAIAKRLDLLREAGVIVAYEYSIVVTQQMQVMGEAQIELTLVPPQELRRITTVVTLRPSL